MFSSNRAVRLVSLPFIPLIFVYISCHWSVTVFAFTDIGPLCTFFAISVWLFEAPVSMVVWVDEWFSVDIGCCNELIWAFTVGVLWAFSVSS